MSKNDGSGMRYAYNLDYHNYYTEDIMVVKISADKYIVNAKQLCKNIDALFDTDVDFGVDAYEPHVEDYASDIPDVESNMDDFTYSSPDEE